MNAHVRALACGLAWALALLAGARPASANDGARKLRHLLRYVAADYRHAVRDGEVASRAEYEEQILLLSDAQKLATSLPGETETLRAAVAHVRALVESKAAEREVVRATSAADALVVGAYRLRDLPASPPDEARGQALYREHCATCHGPTGRGDTARARSLSPPPPDYHDEALGEGMSPLRVSGSVEIGIEGTAMVPFTFLSEQDRWDLGFFVVGLRHAGAPRSAMRPSLSLPELSVLTDGELLDHLYAAGTAEADLAASLAALRSGPLTFHTPLAEARAAWSEARLQRVWGGERHSKYSLLKGHHEGFERARGALGLSAPEAVADVEQRAVHALSALEAGAPRESVDKALSVLLVAATRAELRASATARTGAFPRALNAAWAFLTGCGAAWLAAAAARARAVGPGPRTALLVTAALLTVLWGAPFLATAAGRGRLVAVSLAAGALALLSVMTAAARESAAGAARTSEGGAPGSDPPPAARGGRSPAPGASPLRRHGPSLVLAVAAAVLAGQCVHAGQLAGVLPAHSMSGDLVLFPLVNTTWEAACSQVALLLAGLLAVGLRSRPRR